MTFETRTYLEHLNEWHTEVKVRLVAKNQATAEQESNGEDRAQKDVFRDIDVLDTIEQIGGALKDSCTDSLYDRNDRVEEGGCKPNVSLKSLANRARFSSVSTSKRTTHQGHSIRGRKDSQQRSSAK